VYVRPTSFPGSLAPAAPFGANVSQQLAAYNAMTEVAYLNPEGAYQKVTSEVKADSYAGYGQIDWQFADHWKVAVGARYSVDQKSGTESRRTVVWDPSVAGAAAKAFDNTAPLDCFVPGGERSSTDPNYDRVIDKATGEEIAVPITVGNYMGTCRSREFAEREWSEFTPTAILEWTPIDDFLTYAKYSEGYKSGALRIANFDIDSETMPEHLDAYEIGAKITLASRYQFNVSAFYYDYTDYQFPVTRRLPQDDGTTISIREYANIDAMSGGAELEATLVPIDPLTITLSYSYLKTETTSDLFLLDGADPLALSDESTYPDVLPVLVGTTGPSGVPTARGVGDSLGTEQTVGYAYYQNAKGGSLPNSPTHKASAGIMYNLQFAAGTLVPSLRYSWRDAVSSAGLSISPLSRRTNSTRSYGTGDATVTWIDAQGRYRIIGAVSNLFDDQTANSASRDITDVIRLSLNPPRTWTMTFQYNFGSERR
jgi:iron complex outermembrane receptor protein